MATLITAHLDAEPLSREHRSRERTYGLLVVSALTLLAFVVHGYHPYAEDGGLYIAGVKRLIEPALFPHGAEFVLAPMRWSAFAPTIAWLARASGASVSTQLHRVLPVLLLGLYLASVWMTLFAAWVLTGRCWKGREARTGAVVLLACWLSLPVAGTSLLLMDPYLTARSFTTPLMVLALIGALDTAAVDKAGRVKRWGPFGLWTGSIALAAAMHPLMAGYALWSSLLLFCARSRRREVRVWGTAALCLGACALAGAVYGVSPPESGDYVRVALTRTYWFLSRWRWYELIGVIAPLCILAAAGWGRRYDGGFFRGAFCNDRGTARRALARMAVAAGGTAALIALVLAQPGEPSHLVARMQPLRVFQIVYLVMILVLGASMGETVLRRKAWRWVTAIFLLSAPLLLADCMCFPNSAHVEMPFIGSRNPWVEAFVWIRGNTPKDALVLLEGDYVHAPGEDVHCFRAIAERSVLPDYSKDGGEASIAPELTAAWSVGQAAQRGMSSPEETDAEREERLRPLGVSWVVLQAEARTRLECPFRNGVVEVCRLR